MTRGGLRENAGRKRVGVIINTRIEEQLIEQVDLHIKGFSRADRIRKCLLLGLEHDKQLSKSSLCESNSRTIAKFFKTYTKLLGLLTGTDNEKVIIINSYLLGFFTSFIPSYAEMGTNENTHKVIITELKKYGWSIDEYDSQTNIITPSIIGSVIEKVVNQKDMGAYYTPRDTTNYITEYSIIFSLLYKCNLSTLTYEFYSQFNEHSNIAVLNASCNPVETFANAVNKLFEDEKLLVFKSILGVKIADPTCGTGAFIISAADILVEIYRLTNMYLYVSLNDFVINMFENCLYGVDIMQSAISLINLRCVLYLYNLGISKGIADNIKFNFICGDTLSSETKQDNSSSIWMTQFPRVFDEGGFDCVIGNPPYVEINKTNIVTNYDNYKTLKCGNLYALVVERSIDILKDNCYLGMIVPISITSTNRMGLLRQILINSCENIFISNFSDRPSCLFTGVHQKLSIIFVKKTKPSNGCKIYTSSYNHWTKDERFYLFQSIKYSRATKAFISENGIAKLGSEIKVNILNKVAEMPCSLNDTLSSESNENSLYLNQRMTFWTKCFTKLEPSKEYKKYSFKDSYNSKALAALLNSSLFYLLWETYSDCWHITSRDISNLRFNSDLMKKTNQNHLSKLQQRLEKKLYETREYIYSKQTDYIYVHRKCYNEIKQIDQFIAKIYGFTEEECKYIEHYNLNYRLSISNDTEEK